MRTVGDKGIMGKAGAMRRARRSGGHVFGICLNDHLAGATAGTELAHRIARTHLDQGDGGRLRHFAAEVAQDRAALVEGQQD